MNRFVDIYTSKGEQLAQLGGDGITAVPAVAQFHPTNDWVASGTASGKLSNPGSGNNLVTEYTHCTNDDSSRPLSTCSTIRTSPGPAALFSRKRKRTKSLDDQSSCTPELGTILPEVSEKKHAKSGFGGIRPPPLVYPRSLYTSQQSKKHKERYVLEDILETEASRSASDDDEFISVDLENFSIYRPHQVMARKASKIGTSGLKEKTRSGELASLQDLHDRGSSSFCFDGVLRFGQDGQRREYVQGVPFETLSIGAYEEIVSPTVGSNIWLQSFAGKASNVWYRLQSPSNEYARYHKPFLWLADLAKHVVDCMYTHNSIRLWDFKSAFASWLAGTYSLDDKYLSWRSAHARADFRQIVAAHATFLYNQAGQLGAHYIGQPLWSEIDPAALTAVPRQISQRSATVVTPYVYKCFSHMPWAKFLDPITSQDDHEKGVSRSSLQHHKSPHERITISEGAVKTGDIVAIPSDTDTDWKTEDQYWYAYVQSRKVTDQGQQLGLIWLYRPADTACQNMKYPYPQELFMSDHCNCEDAAIYASEVAHKVRVALFRPLLEPSQAAFFIRQKYDNAESCWTTLQISDFHCQCGKKRDSSRHTYSIGDTVLVRGILTKETLEPVVLLENTTNQAVGKVRVRKLLRKRNDYGDTNAPPNELVYTAREDFCNISTITRRCYVRFYTPYDQNCGSVPAPYNRSGTGDCYYILWEESALGELRLVRQPWPVMKQGFDPLAAPSQKPLRGLDIFCGGGNLGRGLEESQAVKNEWAVDYFNEAIHTYHTNMQHPAQLYNGSVNDYLFQAINARGSGKIAQKGQVEFIAAGSPCQGFSVANHRYSSDQSLLNMSLVASVVAFVDFYRPKYVVMENVLGMANCGPKRAGQGNVFAQVLCALVGLGYQLRPMILDAWNFGAPQGRTRLFISAAAPGLIPLARPPPSHSHPDTVIGRSLGKTANGLSFGSREWEPTPFEYVTIGEATKDLPENIDARTACIPYPDHRVTNNLSALDNVRLRCVPRFPPGQTFVKSSAEGWQPPPQMAAWHWDSKIRGSITSMAYQRAKCNALLPTVTTTNQPGEALTGSALHWDAHRCLTVMEARRAQGYPDDEVIVGTPSMQWKIVGNSVARQPATALGVCLREAWLANGSKVEPPKDAINGRKVGLLFDGNALASSSNGLNDQPDPARAEIRLHGNIEVRLPIKDGKTTSATVQVDSTISAVLRNPQQLL
ncbi:MAG: hypothetical protein Q9226_000713 [Calogaya cf. arnoldii]